MGNYYRTSQDNDITLYSYGELTVMKNLHNLKSKMYIPFSLEEIERELRARSN